MKKIVLGALALIALLVLFFGFFWVLDNKISNFEGPAELYVRRGDTPESVIASIAAQTVIKHPRSLERAFRDKEVEKYMKPGHYRIGRAHSSVYVARMLIYNWQTPVKLTLAGTLRRKPDIARKIAVQMMVDSAEVMAAFNDSALLAKFGVTPSTMFALLMPDTYEVYWTDGMDMILRRQKAAIDAFWTHERDSLAAAAGLSRMQVTILASIVKGESNYEPEFPKIAGVYLNRLRIGMKLQADPTIAFCYDYDMTRVLNRHLLIDSPYNTYRYAGLPPGPICVPTRACLDAVLRPDTSSGYLFFCADPAFNGSHRFAGTYAGHLRNAREYQSALNRRNAEKRKESV